MEAELSALLNFRVHARDGSLGTVRDLYFDDARWTVRYLAVRGHHVTAAHGPDGAGSDHQHRPGIWSDLRGRADGHGCEQSDGQRGESHLAAGGPPWRRSRGPRPHRAPLPHALWHSGRSS
jgi:hypothetical protein